MTGLICSLVYGAAAASLIVYHSGKTVAKGSPIYNSIEKVSGTDQSFESGKGTSTSRLKGNMFVLSIGIDDYPKRVKLNVSFDNSVTDATRYDKFFMNQFASAKDTSHTLKRYLLLNKTAVKDNIISAINDAIANTQPNDYFIFNYSGFCWPVTDSLGKRQTYFVPYGLNNIEDTLEIRNRGIPLKQLKDLLELIPARNQLFITEAGPTKGFQREFMQALIESSPSIAAIASKNRIFILPNSFGLDRFSCNSNMIEQGPLNYIITNLKSNVFNLFEGDVKEKEVTHELSKQFFECDFAQVDYFDVFFEKKLLDDLKFYFPSEQGLSRSNLKGYQDKALQEVYNSRKFALVVGTDVYTGKPDWGDLNNPVLDAKDISNELKNAYGYTTKLLTNASSDDIYESVIQYSKILQPNDQLLIYIAGHGDFDEQLFDDGFLVSNTSKAVKDDPYRNSYIQYSKLQRMINKLPSQQILMVLDVCFGGTFDERVARNQSRSRNVYENLVAEKFLAEKLKKKTRLYLTSGGKREVPDGYKGKHSPFAQKFLMALQSKGGDNKMITATNLYDFVQRLPSGPMLGSFGDDEPGSEFVLIPKLMKQE